VRTQRCVPKCTTASLHIGEASYWVASRLKLVPAASASGQGWEEALKSGDSAGIDMQEQCCHRQAAARRATLRLSTNLFLHALVLGFKASTSPTAESSSLWTGIASAIKYAGLGLS
jgi:hypothetical protein